MISAKYNIPFVVVSFLDFSVADDPDQYFNFHLLSQSTFAEGIVSPVIRNPSSIMPPGNNEY